MTKRICKSVLAIGLCLLFAVPAFAKEQGTLLLKKVSQSVMLFAVADESGKPLEDFIGTVDCLTQNDLTPSTAKVFYQRVLDNRLYGTAGEPNSSQEVTFSSLEEGWYLVCSLGEQAEFSPFLVAVPMIINGQSIYTIQAEPKVDSPADPSVPVVPVDPKPNIPQTGAIQWPKYLLLGLGVIAIGIGLYEVIRGREKTYE